MRPAPAPARLALAILFALPLAFPAAARQDAEVAAQEEYVDRVIDPDKLAPLPEDEESRFDASGLPRSWRTEAVLSHVERGDRDYTEFGLNFGGHRETESHGSLSLDGTVFRRDGVRGESSEWIGSVSLWQRGLFVGENWKVDNGLGVLNTPTVPLQREQYRFFLPSVPFTGASTLWHDAADGTYLQGALGRAGVFSGSRIVAFDSADGNVASFGGQWRLAEHWTGSVSTLLTDGLIVPDPIDGSRFQNGRTEAMLASAAWTGQNHRVQINLQASSGYLGDANGAWLDAQSRFGRYTLNYGAFRLGEDLAWGALPINNDARGAYARLGYQGARWTWNAGLDHIDSVSGRSFQGDYATLFGRYQLRHNLGIGGSLNIRDSQAHTDYSSRWFLDRRGRWGQTRVQLDQASTSGGEREDWLLSVDQDLPMRRGSRLSLSAGMGSRDTRGVGRTDTFMLSALGGIELGDRVSLDGNIRWTHDDGPEAYRGTDMNLSLNWRMATHWWLQASVYRSSGEQRSPFLIDPLAPPDQFFPIPRERSVFLSIRYERQAGTRAMVLGGPPGSATGSIRGSVFLDENGDGIRSPSELPAVNVTVVLDGRYVVRTDSQGGFEFPRVAIGTHELLVVPDNLPLPWFLDGDDERRGIEVKVREASVLDIGARRER